MDRIQTGVIIQDPATHGRKIKGGFFFFNKKKKTKIILNDQDFTSFLFYSNHKQVYTLENKTPKENEWWILNSASLVPFLRQNPNTWIITANLSNLPFEVKKEEIIDYWGNYYFLKINLTTE